MLVSRKSARFSPSSSVAYAVSCSAAFRAVTRDLVSSVFMIYIFDLDGTLYNKKGLKIRMILRSLQAKRPISMLAMERLSRGEISGIDTGNITYETLFDWVRVYQKPEYTGIEDVLNEEEQVSANSSNTVYDLQGRMVQDTKAGGLYIVDGKKVVM